MLFFRYVTIMRMDLLKHFLLPPYFFSHFMWVVLALSVSGPASVSHSLKVLYLHSVPWFY